MIYIASPYSHPDSEVREARYKAAQKKNAEMLNLGLFAYSPIAHAHPIALEHELPTDFDFWREFNFDMITLAEELHVLTLDGWELSKGVKGEIEYAESLGISVVYIGE